MIRIMPARSGCSWMWRRRGNKLLMKERQLPAAVNLSPLI
jgi:hypothetical protein